MPGKGGEEKMSDLRLYIVSHLGKNPCWGLVIAKSPAEAFLNCMKDTNLLQRESRENCKVEEVQIEGYEIIVKEKSGS